VPGEQAHGLAETEISRKCEKYGTGGEPAQIPDGFLPQEERQKHCPKQKDSLKEPVSRGLEAHLIPDMFAKGRITADTLAAGFRSYGSKALFFFVWIQRKSPF
jgi:hypothetical protein